MSFAISLRAIRDLFAWAAIASPGSLPRMLKGLRLELGTYNLLNLFLTVGKHVPDPGRPGRFERISEPQPKSDRHLREQARAILESRLDIVAVQEVESLGALEQFNAKHLSGAYRPFLVPGNDPRGIQVAFLVKRDLPFEVEYRSYKDERWKDPFRGGRAGPLFSRDLPAMIVRASERPQPLLILLGVHFKSKRDRPSDPESRVLRAAQIERAAEIVGRLRREFGAGAPVLLAGDFNGDVDDGREFEPLLRAGLIDCFDALARPPPPEERVSHTYHPIGGATVAHQMDAILVSKSLKEFVQSAEVYRYRDARGRSKPLPRTYEERKGNPSDHFPVLATLAFQKVLASLTPRGK